MADRSADANASTSAEEQHASPNDDSREQAATKIQQAWKGPSKGTSQYMNRDVRWEDVAVLTKSKIDRSAAEQGKNDSKSRWNRAISNISRLEDEDQMLSQIGIRDDAAIHKILETQHWLELIDGKHRYGSNLKYYHKRWQQENTEENFFKWLDRGGGKDLSLPECPRDQLEAERITYLSSEQRLNYLTETDKEGRLRWARNHELVDTTAGRWKDAGDGQGIVADDDNSAKQDRPGAQRQLSSPSISSGSSLGSDEAHYNETGKHSNPVRRAVHKHLTVKGWTEKLLRKTVKSNTWIYVADRNFNIFVGIKDQGKFQHSSFLGGGVVTSAGLISVKDGIIHSLSPLSGHYRTSVEHYRKFLEALKQRGVDTSKVQETKAEAALWGIEHLAKAKSWPSQVATRGKKRISGMFHHKPASKDDGKGAKGEVQHIVDDVGAWKKEVLYGRKGSRNQSETNEKERAEAEKDSQQQTVGKDVVQEGEGQRSREGGGPSDREGQDKEEDHKGEKEQEQEERQEDAYPRKDTDGIRGEREEKKEKEPLAGQQEDTPGSGQGPA